MLRTRTQEPALLAATVAGQGLPTPKSQGSQPFSARHMRHRLPGEPTASSRQGSHKAPENSLPVLAWDAVWLKQLGADSNDVLQ